jgi:hypothetical protein
VLTYQPLTKTLGGRRHGHMAAASLFWRDIAEWRVPDTGTGRCELVLACALVIMAQVTAFPNGRVATTMEEGSAAEDAGDYAARVSWAAAGGRTF